MLLLIMAFRIRTPEEPFKKLTLDRDGFSETKLIRDLTACKKY